MMSNRMTKLTIMLVAVPVFALLLLTSAVSPARANDEEIDGVYKAKCAMCHGVKAEKSFDVSKAEEVLIESVIKGVKPKMPAYEQKLTPDQAKALVSYMKTVAK